MWRLLHSANSASIFSQLPHNALIIIGPDSSALRESQGMRKFLRRMLSESLVYGLEVIIPFYLLSIKAI